MDRQDNNSNVDFTASIRAPYDAPRLIEYGSVAALTASGSGATQEQADLNQCRNSPNLSRC